MKIETVSVRVPGSTSNLGSGFDTLGLALRLYNRVRVSRVVGTDVKIVSQSPVEGRIKATAMLHEAAQLFFKRARVRAFGIEVELSGDVPVGRGLGASATARLGVVVGLNQLTQAGLNREQLLEIVTELEGHPDNASPAMFGGFTVSGRVAGTVRCLRFRVSPRLKFVTLIPRFEINTEEARKLVPPGFSRADTVHSLNRAALISAAFAGGRYEQLGGLFDDRVHQPYREQLLPQLPRVTRAGERAGSIGGWLSGSGSAIMCPTLETPQQVARAMSKQLPESEILILTADNTGAKIE